MSPREPSYTVETRQTGEPWRRSWRGPRHELAVTAAIGLAAERYEPPGMGISNPRYTHVRVRQGKVIVWSSGRQS